MDSQRSIGSERSKRTTRSWYPGDRGRARRSSGAAGEVPPSRGTSGLGTDVGYWGRVDSQGDFEEGSGFLAPFTSRFPWRWLLYAVRRLLPLTVAALVGAVTALAWQSFMLRPPPVPAVRPSWHGPAAPPVPDAPATGRTPAALPHSPAGAAPPAAGPARTAVQVPPSVPLLGSAPSIARAPSEVERPRAARAAPRSPRSPVGKVDANRGVRPAASATPRGPSADPDAILQPSFM